MFKPFIALLIILSYSFSDVKKDYLTDTLPDTLIEEKGINLTEEQYLDTLLKQSDTLYNLSDTINVASITDTSNLSDTIMSNEEDVSKKEKRKSRLRKNNYNHRHQVGTALGMMVFITFILSFGSSINPK